MVTLTGKEIIDLANYALGIRLDDDDFDEDMLEGEFSISECPKIGILDEDSNKVEHYKHVVHCDGCEYNEFSPIGDAIDE